MKKAYFVLIHNVRFRPDKNHGLARLLTAQQSDGGKARKAAVFHTEWANASSTTAAMGSPDRMQTDVPRLLLNFYRNRIGFRNLSPEMTGEPSGMHIEEIECFKRTFKNEELLVLHNLAEID